MRKIDTAVLIKEYTKGTSVKKLSEMFGAHETTIYGHVGVLVQKGVLVSRRKQTERPNRGLKINGKANRPNMLVMEKSRTNAPMKLKEYEPLGVGVSILELTNKTCRWPCRDGIYCGAEVHNRGYCKEHYTTSVQPNQKASK